jgi:HEAT repeat protein
MVRSFLPAMCLGVVLVACGPAFGAPPYGVRPDDEKRLKDARVAVDGPGLVEYLRSQILSGAEQARARALIARLGSDSFEERRRASARLAELGPRVRPMLQRGLGSPDEEINDRLRELLVALEKDQGPKLRAAAVRLLRGKASAGAVSALLDLLPVTDDDELEEDVLLTLLMVGVKDGKVDPSLAGALTHPNSARRRAAALVLGRSGTTEERTAVKARLTDPDVGVRFRAAQGLLAARDRAAIPALIALLHDAPPALYPRVEDMLFAAAGSRGPRYATDSDATARRAAQTAWTAWWRANGKVDLTRADVEAAPFRTGPAWRETARRFLLSLAAGDMDGVKRTAAVPFVFGDVVLPGTEELELVMGQLALLVQAAPDSFALLATQTAEEFQKSASPEDRAWLKRLPRGELRVLPLQGRQRNGARQSYETALVLQLVEGRPRVVGITRIR